MTEIELHLIFLDLHVVIDRSLASDGVVAIGLVERHIGQSLSYGSLVLWMDLSFFEGFYQVVGRDHTAMRNQLRGLVLLLAQQGSVIFLPIIIGSNLH